MIRRCTETEIPAINVIINEAAEVYRGGYWDIPARQEEMSVVLARM